MITKTEIANKIKRCIPPIRDKTGHVVTYGFAAILRDGTRIDTVLSQVEERYLVLRHDSGGKCYYEYTSERIHPHDLTVHNYLSLDHVVDVVPSPYRLPDHLLPSAREWARDRQDNLSLRINFRDGQVFHLFSAHFDGYFYRIPAPLTWDDIISSEAEHVRDDRMCIYDMVAYRCLICGLQDECA